MDLAERISKLSPEKRKILELKLKQQGIKIDKGDIYRTVEPAEKKEYYALSSAQKRFYMLQQLDMEGMVFNMFHMMSIEGKLDKQRCERAFSQLINRHYSLRTSIEMLEGEPRQKIHPAAAFNIEYFDAREEEEIEKIIRGFSRPFDLKRPPLLRLGLVSLTEEKHFLLFDMHHIISDAASVNLLVKNLITFYSGENLPPLALQYKDFCQWQDRVLTSGTLKEQEEFWLNYLSGDLPVLNMPADYPRPSFQSFAGDSIDFQFDEVFTRKLHALMKETGTTLFMVLLALYTILLSKYTRQQDILIGIPIAGRSQKDLEDVIGLFIETLVIRNFPAGDKTFDAFLKEVKENTLNAFENQAYPFRELLKKVADEGDFSRNPLFDAMLIVQKRDTSLETFQVGELRFMPYERASHVEAKVDINLDVKEKDGKVFFTLEYCTALFERETMERFASFFKKAASTAVDNKGIKLADIKLSHDLMTASSDIYEQAGLEFEF